jgi:Na+/H+ antiporter NhaD/arsenite permease-like protein
MAAMFQPHIFLVAATANPQPAMMLPFALMLLAIAFMPFIRPRWWELHLPKVAGVLGAITIFYYVIVLGDAGRMGHLAHEYASFIILIGSLYVVAGGIHFDLAGEAKPWMNCLFLFAGAVLANLIGTTGASMLLIRPWIRMNKTRITAFHIVFFIFIVSNVGGCLTPIGDPPLFLGYLRGVPFWWVLTKCWLAWAIAVLLLISIFYFLDRQNFLRLPREAAMAETKREVWKIEGWRNLGCLGVILGAVFVKRPPGLGEALMLGAAVVSWFATPKGVHEANKFSFHPMREVAWLFAGIFATMAPALDYLELHASQLGLSSAARFFWLTGMLSAGLDNAPTYLAFLATGMGRQHLSLNDPSQVLDYVNQHGHELMAISLGAVFFGAMTYIGNGPNLMVKSIAESEKIKIPGFFNYVVRYAIPILLPLFLLICVLFFSRGR